MRVNSGFQVLEALATDGDKTIMEIAEITGLPLTKVRSAMSRLSSKGAVRTTAVKVGKNAVYTLTLKERKNHTKPEGTKTLKVKPNGGNVPQFGDELVDAASSVIARLHGHEKALQSIMGICKEALSHGQSEA